MPMPDKVLRPPPSFVAYASDDLSAARYYLMSAGERGLKHSMDLVWWVDGHLPSEPALLALALRLREADVAPFLTPSVLAFFRRDERDPSTLHSIELERQMNNIRVMREKQSEGGKLGADLTNKGKRTGRKAKHGKASGNGTAIPASTPAPIPAGLGRVPERKKELKEQDLSLGDTNASPAYKDWMHGSASDLDSDLEITGGAATRK